MTARRLSLKQFVSTAVAHVNRRLIEIYGERPVQWFVTINEPNMLVLNTYLNRHFPGGGHRGMKVAVTAYNRLLAAHVRAYNAIHDLFESEGWGTPRVTMNTFCSDVYWSEKMLLDLLCLRERGVRTPELKAYLREGSSGLHQALLKADLPFHSDPFVWLGRLFHILVNALAPKHAVSDTFEYFLDTLANSKRDRVLDYLGLDYYDPFTGHLFRPPFFGDLEFRKESLRSHLMDSLSRKWWDWHVLPEGLHFFCKYYASEFQRGILIAENGMALRRKFDNSVAHPRRDRLTRSEFLKAHVAEIRRLLAEQVPMLGYLHWSDHRQLRMGILHPAVWAFQYRLHKSCGTARSGPPGRPTLRDLCAAGCAMPQRNGRSSICLSWNAAPGIYPRIAYRFEPSGEGGQQRAPASPAWEALLWRLSRRGGWRRG